MKSSFNALGRMKECKQRQQNAREPERTKQPFGVSHSPDDSFNLQPLFTHLNFSDSEADCCYVTRVSGWQKSGNEGSFLQKQNGLYPLVPQSDTRVQSF